MPRLAQPLLQAALQAAQDAGAADALVPRDWSHLDYRRHAATQDTIPIGQQEAIGDERFAALLVSDRAGTPLAPLALRRQAAAGVDSSWQEDPQPPQAPLDDREPVVDYGQRRPRAKRPVFRSAAAADSVYHFRQWHAREALFRIRGAGPRRVRWEGADWALPDLAAALTTRQAFRLVVSALRAADGAVLERW